MKKQTILPILALLMLGFSQITFAQISIGVRGGISLNNFKVDPLEEGEPDPESVVGFQVAIPVEIALGDMFAIQPEVIYATHGAKQEDSNVSTEGGFTSTSDFKSETSISALEIPILAKVKFGSESLKFHVLAGPSFGFGLGGNSTIVGNVRVTDPNGGIFFEQSIDDEFDAKFVGNDYDPSDVSDEEFAVSKTNLNLHMGAGVSFKVGPANLFLDARYMLGLSDLSPEAEGQAKEDGVTIKSNRIGVSLGVMFPLN